MGEKRPGLPREVQEIILGIGRALARQAAQEDDAAEEAQRLASRKKIAARKAPRSAKRKGPGG